MDVTALIKALDEIERLQNQLMENRQLVEGGRNKGARVKVKSYNSIPDTYDDNANPHRVEVLDLLLTYILKA